MNEEEIIKKCEGIDNEKEDLSIIEKFEQIYSNFMISKHSPRIPKIIKDEESFLISKKGEENLYDKNESNNPIKKPLDLNRNNENQENEEIIENEDKEHNKNNKLIKSLIEPNKELITEKLLNTEINGINEINNNSENIKEKIKNKKPVEVKNKNEISKSEKKIKIQNIIEKMKQNKQKYKKSKEKINNLKKNKIIIKSKERKGMKDIYKHIYGVLDDDVYMNTNKKYNIKNAYERLYNQGFYTKNKSQINILDNINKIKTDSNHNNISKKSKELLGLNKQGQNRNNQTPKKYDKNNIYKAIKTNIPTNIDLTFRPKLNKNTIKIAERLEDSFIRLTRPKSLTKMNTSKKINNNKEKYKNCMKKVNYLYLDGVEKMKKKRQLKSCPPTEITDENEVKLKSKKNDFNLKLENLKNSRNTYYRQIQWKKKIIFENMKKKRINDNYDNSECTFKPKIDKVNYKKMFRKHLSDTDISSKKSKSYFDIYYAPKLKKFRISKQRYFIVNNINQINNNKISIYYQKDKEQGNETEKRYIHNKENIQLGLIKRKLYNLEKFFAKKNL